MVSNGYQQFFLEPRDTWHRRYEALRAVFVDRQPMEEVAERFEVSYGTVRNWSAEFRTQRDQGQSPPFFSSHRAAVPRTLRPRNRPQKNPRSPTPKR